MKRNSRLDEVIPTFESKGFISLLCEGNAMFDGNAFQLILFIIMALFLISMMKC